MVDEEQGEGRAHIPACAGRGAWHRAAVGEREVRYTFGLGPELVGRAFGRDRSGPQTRAGWDAGGARVPEGRATCDGSAGGGHGPVRLRAWAPRSCASTRLQQPEVPRGPFS